MFDEKTLCIFDANLNRLTEGLRVVEDICRFVLCDEKLTSQLKSLRHGCRRLVESLCSANKLPLARFFSKDVGALLYTSAEGNRKNLQELAHANFSRCAESLRAFEEFGKLKASRLGKEFKALRFRLYTSEQQILAKLTRKELLRAFEKARLYVVLDRRYSKLSYARLCKAAISGGVKIIQLHEKNAPSGKLLQIARQLRKICSLEGALFVINDRPDIAKLCNADGVHLGQEDLSIAEARAILGHDKLVGKSTHSLKQAIVAERNGADYISVGPIFGSPLKPNWKPVGTKLIRSVKKKVRVPFVAIGGINSDNIKKVLKSGAKRVAVVRAVVSAKDPKQAAKELLRAFKKA